MKNLRQLIRRYTNKSPAKRRRPVTSRRGDNQFRQLTSETLERRELLAAGILEMHNPWNQFDVNNDRAITARDALSVINYLGRGESEQVESGLNRMFYDVNGDNLITSSDALSVINAIGRGEAAEEPLVELLLTARQTGVEPGGAADDYNLDLIVPDANGEVTVEVGKPFDIEVSYEDLRIFSDERLGAFQLIVDLVTSSPNVIKPVLYETQQLIVDEAFRDIPFSDRPNTSVTLSIPNAPPGVTGGSLTYQATFNEFANAQVGVTNALEAFGYSADQFRLQTPGQIGNNLGVEIVWTDSAFANVDLPDISIEVNEAPGSANITTDNVAIDPVIDVNGTPQFNPDAIPFNINTFSRTFKQSSNFSFGEPFYNSNNDGTFDPATGYTAVKGIGGIPSQGGGIPQLIPAISYPDGPFDAFAFTVIIDQPVTDFRIDLFPNDDQGADTEAILIYGEDERIPITNDSVIIERPGDADVMGNGNASLIINAVTVGGNQNPTVSQAITKTFNEDQGNQNVDLLEFSSDPDNDTLTVTGFTVTSDPSNAVTRSGSNVTVNTAAYSALNDGQNQVINLAYTLDDGNGGTVAQTATITITGITDVTNGNPTVSQAITKTFNEDQGNQNVDLLEFSSDPDNDTLTVTGFTVTSDPSNAVTRSGSNVTVNTAAYSALNDGQNQVINLAYTLDDGNGGTVAQTATITITGITDVTNGNPTVSQAITKTFNEDQGNQNVDLLEFSSDPDNDTLTVTGFTVSGDPSNAVTRSGSNVTVNTAAYSALNDGQNQVINLAYTLDDGNGGTVAQTATITITGITDVVNSRPTATPITRTFTEGADNGNINLNSGATDADGDTLTRTAPVLESGNAVGITISGSNMTVNPRMYRYLLPGDSEVIRYNYTMTDGKSAPVNTSVTVTINGATDDAPTTGNVPAVSTPKDSGPVTIDVLAQANAGAGETQTLSIFSASLANPAAGTLTSNGTLVFTPAPGFSGATQINYAISDGTSQANGTVALTVTDIQPSTIGGSVFIDRIENMRAVIDGAAPVRDGMKDDNEQGFGGVEIKLMGNGMTFTVVTDINGNYEFNNVMPGNYEVVYDAPSNVLYNGPSSMLITIGAGGGVNEQNMNVPLLGLAPGATNAVDVLARTYLNSAPEIQSLSNGGREGAVVSFDAAGNSNFFLAGEGFDGIRYADVRAISGSSQDMALLTVMKENGEVMHATVNRDQAVASPDGSTMRFFGGVDDFNFQVASQNANNYDDFRDAIDQILADI